MNITHSPLRASLLLGCLAASQQVLATGFIDDSSATLSLRNYYYNNDKRSGAANPSKTEEWGQGFMLNLKSGFTPGTVGFGLDAVGMLGVSLDSAGQQGNAQSERQPGIMFPLKHNNTVDDTFSTLGLTGKARVAKTELRVGTLQPLIPVLQNNDGRLLPMWFEGAQVKSNDIDNLSLLAGRLEHVKAPGSTNLEGMRIGGGTARSNEFLYAGADYKLAKNLTVQYYFGQLTDYYDQHFLGLVYDLPLGPGTLRSDLRYFNSSSNGANGSDAQYASTGYYPSASHAGEVDNRTYSSLFTYSVSGHSLAAGYQVLSGKSDFPFINQSDGSSAYLPTSIQVLKFTRAGERSWLARYGYDFAALGLPGLAASVVYIKGTDIAAAGYTPSEWERDTTLSYTVQSGPLKNLSVSWKKAVVRSEVRNFRDQNEDRLIFNYSIALW